MAKVGFTNQQCNKVDIIVLHYTLRRCMKLSHWKHILMSNALIFPIENWLSFQCKFYKNCYKDKNTISYHRMMMQCPKYKGKEFLKMYLTWTKSKAKKLTRLREKHRKTLLNKSRCPNNDATKHPNKVTSTSLKSQDITLPPPRPIHQKDMVVVELNNDGDFSSTHF